MASAWGDSWGASWGDSWGSLPDGEIDREGALIGSSSRARMIRDEDELFSIVTMWMGIIANG